MIPRADPKEPVMAGQNGSTRRLLKESWLDVPEQIHSEQVRVIPRMLGSITGTFHANFKQLAHHHQIPDLSNTS